MPSFALSIVFLSLIQAGLILVPRRRPGPHFAGLTGRWWALLPPGSIIAVTAGIGAIPNSAHALTYLALFAVPVLAAFALAWLVPAANPRLAWAVALLFGFAWVLRGSVVGQLSALALSALACVTLGSLLVEVVSERWLKFGLYAMAFIDTVLVVAGLLQHPNSVLNLVGPVAHLPRLQTAHFGSAAMGFGDLFIAATTGAILASRRRVQVETALIAAVLGLGFDCLFFVIRELPATVPIALALALSDLRFGPRRGVPVPIRSPKGEPVLGWAEKLRCAA